jgi:ABC-type multidrug transport system ATPase subunit
LTVYETFLIAAHFYLPDDVSLESKKELVENVINELGLAKARDTNIGSEAVRGVSGGERKRANIGVQMITDPAVLFLDEPTSGLDAFQAQAVMESMKSLASNGRLVISVIHQPRSSIFDMFDQLMLLSEGRCVYLGKSSEAASFFNDIGYPCHRFFNPSDFFLDILSPDYRTKELENSTFATILNISKKWKEIEHERNRTTIDELSATHEVLVNVSSIQGSKQKFSLKRLHNNFKLLMWRAYAEQSRNKTVMIAKFVLTLIFGFLLAGIFSNCKHNQKGFNFFFIF